MHGVVAPGREIQLRVQNQGGQTRQGQSAFTLHQGCGQGQFVQAETVLQGRVGRPVQREVFEARLLAVQQDAQVCGADFPHQRVAAGEHAQQQRLQGQPVWPGPVGQRQQFAQCRFLRQGESREGDIAQAQQFAVVFLQENAVHGRLFREAAFPVAHQYGVAIEGHAQALLWNVYAGGHGRDAQFPDAHAVENIERVPAGCAFQQFPDQAAFQPDQIGFLTPRHAARADGTQAGHGGEVGNAHVLAHRQHALFRQNRVAQGRKEQQHPQGEPEGGFLQRIEQRTSGQGGHLAAHFSAAQSQATGKGRKADFLHVRRGELQLAGNGRGIGKSGNFPPRQLLHLRTNPESQRGNAGQAQNRQNHNSTEQIFHVHFPPVQSIR